MPERFFLQYILCLQSLQYVMSLHILSVRRLSEVQEYTCLLAVPRPATVHLLEYEYRHWDNFVNCFTLSITSECKSQYKISQAVNNLWLV